MIFSRIALVSFVALLGCEIVNGQTEASNECVILQRNSLCIPNMECLDEVNFECEFDDGHAVPIVMTEEGKEMMSMMMQEFTISSGSTVLVYSDYERDDAGIHLSSLEHMNFYNKEEEGGRRLASKKTGDVYYLTVRVIDQNGLAYSHDTATMGDNIFGQINDPVNLKSQIEACSDNQLRIHSGYPPTATQAQKDIIDNVTTALGHPEGLMEVTIPIDITTTGDKYAVRNAIITEVQTVLGFNLPGPFDHVIFVVEDCYGSCPWAAYAYINSWNQVYRGQYYSLTGVLVHEYGHNLGLYHSGIAGGTEYTDHTCQMGNPLYSDDTGKMCFNPAKNFYLDWYDSLEINPITDGDWSGEMMGVGEWGDYNVTYPAVVKIEAGSDDYYVGFNRAAGSNSDNVAGDDKVTITRTSSSTSVSPQSWREALLGVNQSWTLPDFRGTGRELTVTANTIDTQSSPGLADISLALTPLCSNSSFCEDNNQCTTNVCSPTLGICVYDPIDCSDGNACTADTCDNGNCTNTPIDCDDGNACTTDTCDANSGCVNTPISNCCGNDICEEPIEDTSTCPQDCAVGPFTITTGCKTNSCSYSVSSSYNGILFDVEAKAVRDVIMESLTSKAYNVGTTLEVWTRPGSHVGYELSFDGWTKVANHTFGSLPDRSTVEIPESSFLEKVVVEAGTKKGFLVTWDSTGSIYGFSGAPQGVGAVVSEDDNLLIYGGVLRRYGTPQLYGNKVMVGSFTYLHNDATLSPSLSISPSQSPSTAAPSLSLVPTIFPTTAQPTEPPTATPTEAPVAPTPVPIYPSEYDYSGGFCSDEPFSLNGNKIPYYPRYLTSSNCALQLTDDNTSSAAVSAFIPTTITNDFTFSTTIGYRMYGTSGGSADGMAFVMHQDPRKELAYGGSGGKMGVYGTNGIKPALVIELDNYKGAIENDNYEDAAHVQLNLQVVCRNW